MPNRRFEKEWAQGDIMEVIDRPSSFLAAFEKIALSAIAAWGV